MKQFLLILSCFIAFNLFCQTAEEYYIKAIDQRLSSNYTESLENYTLAISLKSDKGEYYLGRGLVKQTTGDYQGAIVDITEGINKGFLNSKDIGTAFFNRGKCKAQLKDHRGAIEDFNEALKYINAVEKYQLGSVYLQRGVSKIEIKQIDEGCLDFSKAGEFGRKEAYDLIEKFCL